MRRWRRPALAVALAAALVAAAALFHAYRHPHADGYTSKDLDGNTVLWDRRPDIAGAHVRDTGGRLVAPAQQLSVPLLSAEVTSGTINPPTLTDAFLMRDYGRPQRPATGQTVVALHSVHDGRGPGNAFFDMDSDDPVRVDRGDPILVDGVRFLVTRTEIRSRSATAADRGVWGHWRSRGNRLVVITCLQHRDEAPSESDNLVILARRAPVS